MDNVKKYFYGPGWFPNMNLPRLGDNNLVEEKPNRTIHYSSIRFFGHCNILVQLIAIICVHDVFTTQFHLLDAKQVLVFTIFLVWTGINIGLIYDSVEYRGKLEILRCLVFTIYFLYTGMTYNVIVIPSLFSSFFLHTILF